MWFIIHIFTHGTSAHRPSVPTQWLWTRVTNSVTWIRGEEAFRSQWTFPTCTGEACPWMIGICAPRRRRLGKPTSFPTFCAARPTLRVMSTEAAAPRTLLTRWSPPGARQTPRSTRWSSSGSTGLASPAWRASLEGLRTPVTTAMKQVNGDAKNESSAYIYIHTLTEDFHWYIRVWQLCGSFHAFKYVRMGKIVVV